MDPKIIKNASSMLIDLLNGDEAIIGREDYNSLKPAQIKKALDYLKNYPGLSSEDQIFLASNSWRINYRDKPPTPTNFISEKYLGPVATHTYPRVKLAFEEFMNPMKPYRNGILYPHIGFGKEIDRYNTKIHTPTGPRIADEIQIGDEVCTPSGKYAKVINRKVWENEEFATITFSDGRTLHSGLDHYFKAAKSNNTRVWNKEKKAYEKTDYPKPCWKIITLREIIKDLEKNPQARWFIPLTNPVQYEKNTHVISPYTLGAMLGDGHFSENHTVNIYGDDEEIHISCKEGLPPSQTFLETSSRSCNFVTIFRKGPFYEEVERMGLSQTRCHDKFIPREYLYDSIENRVALLQGLLDTDGTVGKKEKNRSHVSFYTTSPFLRDDFITLVRGLGGFARYFTDKKERRETSNYDGYIIYITFPRNDFPLFRLTRKQSIVDKDFNSPRTKNKPKYLYIKNIEKTENTEGLCIELDDEEKLFLVDDYVVTHNSYLGGLITLYIGTHLSMMREPYKFFGRNPASVFTQLLVSYSLKKSSELLLEPLIAMMENSPFFEKVHTREGMIKKDRDFSRTNNVDKIYWTTAVPTSAIQMSNGANIKLASNPTSLLGLTVVSGVLSELAFFRDAGKSDDFIMRVFNDLKSRINNRMQGNYFGRTVLDSSPNTLDSPIDDYIVNHAKNDPTNFIVKGSEWEWAPEDFDMTKTFKVYTGGKGQPPKILDEDESEDQYSPEKLIDVPMELKQSFKNDLYKSLKDRAGIPAGSADMLIYDHQKIEDIFNPKLKNIYTHIKASENQNSYRLIWDQIAHKFFRERAGKLEFWYKPWLPRCISVDQSIVGDVTCIGMVHAERIRESEEQMFVVDFTIPIAPAGERINLDAIKFFIEDLRDVGNMYIPHVSFDQFQSELSLQYLRSKGFDAEKLSVDRTTDPYFFLLGLVNRGNIVAGRNLHIKNNLKSLKLVTEHRGKAKKAKVDHDDSRPVVTSGTEEWSKSLIGAFAKDATDSIAGAIELNRMYFPVATEFWDPAYLDTLLDTKKQRKNAEGSVSAFLNKMGVG